MIAEKNRYNTVTVYTEKVGHLIIVLVIYTSRNEYSIQIIFYLLSHAIFLNAFFILFPQHYLNGLTETILR